MLKAFSRNFRSLRASQTLASKSFRSCLLIAQAGGSEKHVDSTKVRFSHLQFQAKPAKTGTMTQLFRVEISLDLEMAAMAKAWSIARASIETAVCSRHHMAAIASYIQMLYHAIPYYTYICKWILYIDCKHCTNFHTLKCWYWNEPHQQSHDGYRVVRVLPVPPIIKHTNHYLCASICRRWWKRSNAPPVRLMLLSILPNGTNMCQHGNNFWLECFFIFLFHCYWK